MTEHRRSSHSSLFFVPSSPFPSSSSFDRDDLTDNHCTAAIRQISSATLTTNTTRTTQSTSRRKLMKALTYRDATTACGAAIMLIFLHLILLSPKRDLVQAALPSSASSSSSSFDLSQNRQNIPVSTTITRKFTDGHDFFSSPVTNNSQGKGIIYVNHAFSNPIDNMSTLDSFAATTSQRGPVQIRRLSTTGTSVDEDLISSVSTAVLFNGTGTPGIDILVTAVHDTKTQHIRLLAWTVSRGGDIGERGIVDRIADSYGTQMIDSQGTGGEGPVVRVFDLCATRIANGNGVPGINNIVVVAVVDPDSKLKILTYKLERVLRNTQDGDTKEKAEYSYAFTPSADSFTTSDPNGNTNSVMVDPAFVRVTTMPDEKGILPSYILTASLSDRGSNLMLTTWSLLPTSQSSSSSSAQPVIKYIDTISAGPVFETSLIRLAYPFHRYVSTSVRTGASLSLKVILWHVGYDGRLARVADSGAAAGVASIVRSTSNGGSLYTAVKTGEGALKIIRWIPQYTPWTFDLLRAGDSGVQAGAVEDEAGIVTESGSTFTRLVCAVRMKSDGPGRGRVRIISWIVNRRGSFVREGDTGPKGGTEKEGDGLDGVGVDEDDGVYSFVNVDFASGRVVTSGRTEDGRLRLVVWSITYS